MRVYLNFELDRKLSERTRNVEKGFLVGMETYMEWKAKRGWKAGFTNGEEDAKNTKHFSIFV